MERKQLQSAVKYMKLVTPMVAGQFVKFIPISYVHEPSKEIPINYSENYFSDVLPTELLKWFHKYAKVYSLRKSQDSWFFKPEEPLVPSRGIVVEFEGDSSKQASIYHLFEVEFEKINKNGKVTMKQWLPDEPPEKERFLTWVYQSINRSSLAVFQSVFAEVSNAAKIGSMYLTTSQFISELLNRNIRIDRGFETEIANLVMNLDIPIIDNVGIQRLMDIRNSDGKFATLFSHMKVMKSKPYSYKVLRKI